MKIGFGWSTGIGRDLGSLRLGFDPHRWRLSLDDVIGEENMNSRKGIQKT